MKTFNSLIHRCRSRLAFMRNPRQWGIGLAAFALAFGLVAWGKDSVSLVYSSTDSLPWRYFIKLKQLVPHQGDYTCVDCPWYGGTVIKKIVGISGDLIHYDFEGNLWIRRHLKVGRPRKKTRDGRPLTPIASGIIPEGQVFVAGGHERSLDSRYAEVGLIPAENLRGKVVPLV